MLKEDIRFQKSTCFEGMTSIRAIIRGVDSGVNERQIKTIYYDAQRYAKITKEVGYLKAVSSKYGFDVVASDSSLLNEYTVGSSHGGIIAIAEERVIPDVSSLPESTLFNKNGFYCMIQGIEDPYNFGYSIRSLYACGCDGIILGERNWMSAAGVVCRSSAGASEMIPMFKGDDESAISFFKSRGFTVICADEKTDNILGKCPLELPLLLLVGGEKRGISRSALEKADILVKIDYSREFNASLSAASATTMFAYEIMRQNKQ